MNTERVSDGQERNTGNGPRAAARAEEHQGKADLLNVDSQILKLLSEKLTSAQVVDSNPLETGVITIDIRDLMSATSVWSRLGAARRITQGADVVSDAAEFWRLQAVNARQLEIGHLPEEMPLGTTLPSDDAH